MNSATARRALDTTGPDLKTKLRLRVEAIEAARKERGWTQGEFSEMCGISAGHYREILRKTRGDEFPNVGTDIIAGVLSALSWTQGQAVEQVVINEGDQ